MDLAERIQLTISSVISVLMVLVFLTGLYQGQLFNAFLAFLIIVFSYLPALVERNYKIVLPVEFEFTMVVFLFLAIYLGSIVGYYDTYWWWDVFVHSISGVILGMVGFMIVYILKTESRFDLNISPVFVGVFSFLFAVTLGTLWEIIEFIIDLTGMLHTKMQADNFDTMKDLIDDSLGGLLIAISGYLYCKKVRVPLLDRVMGKFVEKNPSLFARFRKRSKAFFKRRIDAVKRIRSATLRRVHLLMKQLKNLPRPRHRSRTKR